MAVAELGHQRWENGVQAEQRGRAIERGARRKEGQAFDARGLQELAPVQPRQAGGTAKDVAEAAGVLHSEQFMEDRAAKIGIEQGGPTRLRQAAAEVRDDRRLALAWIRARDKDGARGIGRPLVSP